MTIKILQLALTLATLAAWVAGMGTEHHVEVGGLFDFRDSPNESKHVDDSFFNTDILSMYNSVLNHVSNTNYIHEAIICFKNPFRT